MARVTFNRFLVFVAGNVAVFIFLLTIIELIAYGLYSHPPKNKVWELAVQEFYRSHEGHIIQYEVDCARFDPTLAYTLRPGACEFENREFKTQVEINSLGLRDDEESLVAPEIIVLGDSFAMGWGVEQEASFPPLLEEKLGRKVLNAGISSFGTARQTILLDRLDMSKLKLLIIQYNDNDFLENDKFIGSGLTIKTMDKRSYVITKHRLLDRIKRYRFGKYFSQFLPELKKQAEKMAKENPENPDWAKQANRMDYQQAKLFYRVLLGAIVDLSEVPILVIELNNHGENNNGFLGHLEERKLMEEKKLDLHTLDVSPVLSPDHYFIHDAHMRQDGHEIVADLLYDYITTTGWLQ